MEGFLIFDNALNSSTALRIASFDAKISFLKFSKNKITHPH